MSLMNEPIGMWKVATKQVYALVCPFSVVQCSI